MKRASLLASIYLQKSEYIAASGSGCSSNLQGLLLGYIDNTLISSSEVYKDADYDISWSRNLDNSWLFSTTVTPEKANIFTSKQDEIINAPVIPIEKAKKQEKNDWVKIEGIVTSPPGLFGKKVMYIQDASGGIKIYFDKCQI